MRAVQFSRFGGPEVLNIVDLPTPSPGPGQVLVRVCAAGVNFFETLMRQDRYAVTPPLPTVLGVEVAGIVEALGEGVKEPEVGKRIAAPLFAAGQTMGGYADFVIIDVAYAVPLPDALSFEEATALMVQGLTALHLTRRAPPKGKTVMISAAAGGVGSLLVQLAKRSGAARVIAGASSPEKLDFARALGADAAVDYTADDWTDALLAASDGKGPDIVYESVGGKVLDESLAAMAPLGTLVIYGALNIQSFAFGVPELKQLIFKNLTMTGFGLLPLLTPQNLQPDLTALFDLAVRKEISVAIGQRFPLEQTAEAHRAIETRRTTGKVVLLA